MTTKLDDVLTGVIILLLVVVFWKWAYYGDSYRRLSCGCMMGNCRCGVPSYLANSNKTRSQVNMPVKQQEGLTNVLKKVPHNVQQVVEAGPPINYGGVAQYDYQEATKLMGVEPSVGSSHKDWCNSMTMNGVPTGASSCTTLEETGRSYGTADFVGLTARKFCKARQLATPAPDSRVTPSQDVLEYCDINMDELI